MSKTNNIFKSMLGKFKLLWHSLFMGMRNVDVILTTNQTNGEGSSFEIPENGGGGVYKDLLEQKVTQEVEELRYVSYHVAKESKKYKYVGNGQAVKKTESQLTEKHVNVDESDNLPIVLIQDNNIVCEDVYTILKEVDKKEDKKTRSDYNIIIVRDVVPRFYIEDYIKKVVVKNAGDNYVLDLYCSMYPRQFSEKKDKAFLSEVKRIKKGVLNSDIIDIQRLSWVTSNAWGVDDWLHYVFTDFEYYDIVEFDGSYIFRFGCKAEIFGENLLDKIYSASADKKYKKKEAKKNRIIRLYEPEKEKHGIPSNIDLNKLSEVTFDIENVNKKK